MNVPLLATVQNCLSEECCVLSDIIMFLYLPLRRQRPTQGCRVDDDEDDDIYYYNPALWFDRLLLCYISQRNNLDLDTHLCNRVVSHKDGGFRQSCLEGLTRYVPTWSR